MPVPPKHPNLTPDQQEARSGIIREVCHLQLDQLYGPQSPPDWSQSRLMIVEKLQKLPTPYNMANLSPFEQAVFGNVWREATQTRDYLRDPYQHRCSC